MKFLTKENSTMRLFKKRKKSYLEKLKEDGLQVGKNFTMEAECIIDNSHCWHIIIGDNVTLAPRVYILAHDSSTKMHVNYTKIGKVTIGDSVFIGAASIILPGVSIGSRVIIGAGSVVTKDIPNNSVAVGNPAKVVSKLDDYLKRVKNEMGEYPLFNESYTLRENVSDAMKDEMNNKMSKDFGYII